MGAGAEVARGANVEVEAAVAREQVEHVVEEPNPGLAPAGSGAVEGQGDVDVGLTGLAFDRGGAAHDDPFWRTRASIERA